MTKTQFYKILFLVSFWVMAAIFIVSYEGVVLGFQQPVDMAQRGTSYHFSIYLITGVLFTFVIGTAMACFEVLYLNNVLRKKPFGITLLIKTLFYLSNIFVWSSVAIIIMYSYDVNKPIFHEQVLIVFYDYLFSTRLLMTMLWWGFTIMMSLFILQVADKFGQGVLLNFLLGKYHKPKEENRIFMFMDLRSSTTYAEKLGHIKYSQLIQDCFFDVTEIIRRYEAKIYQYVGDEVVLSWELDKGIQNNNCINTYFAYDKLLNSKSNYYKKKYGIVPEFKAGVNSGFVTVAEVGELKKELAYHGDVLNTAARIQGKCNEYKSKLLISEEIKNKLDEKSNHSFELIGNIKLKGKEQSVNIYDVRKNDQKS